MEPEIISTRRANLRAWVAKHGTPQSEKSYFSQLMNSGSFGERAARRLERDYKMGEMFLDKPQGLTAGEQGEMPPPSPDVPVDRTELTRVNDLELRLLTLFREKTERGKATIMMQAEVAEKSKLSGIRGNYS